MADNFAAIANLLSCPNDGASLSHSSGELRSDHCRRFPIHAEDIVEILSKRPCDLPLTIHTEYRGGYFQASEQTFREDDSALASGGEEAVAKS